MNTHILDQPAQAFIAKHLNDDVHAIAMAKSTVEGVSSKELSSQIAAKRKAVKKLPTWFNTPLIFYPPVLSIEQTSSEITASYKATLAVGSTLVDLTGGFGVDGFYFSKAIENTTHCEIDTALLAIAKYNACLLGQNNTEFKAVDGLEFLKENSGSYDTIYIDPARRSSSGKVFMLKDCSPNVVEHLALLLERSKRLIIKTAPMLDITAGLNELKHVSEVHIVSLKNEVKELLWILDKEAKPEIKITAVTLNEQKKTFSFYKEIAQEADLLETEPEGYLYEPDAALLKSGAFNLIGTHYQLKKLNSLTQLYVSPTVNTSFPGRIFKINRVFSSGDLKKERELAGNVIVRNYRDKPENLVKKYKIKPDDRRFLIFTQSKLNGFLVIDAEIIQHY